MSRLEKKCFIGAAAGHGLLLVAFVFGAAFLPSNPNETLPPVITIFDATVTDRLVASGGNPNATPAPAPPAPQEEQVQPPPPKPEPPPLPEVKPEPKPPVQEKEKEKVKPEPKKEVVEKDRGELPKRADSKKDIADKPKINTTVVRRTNEVLRLQREAADRAARESERKEREATARWIEEKRRIAGQVGGIIGSVGKSIGKSTVVEAVGPGGKAYVNYGSLVGEVYKRAVYAAHPQSDQDAEATIKVLVARDGAVRSSQWVRRTGNSVLDNAVDRAMRSVRALPEFPPESKDSERSFNITIAFEAKRVSA